MLPKSFRSIEENPHLLSQIISINFRVTPSVYGHFLSQKV